MQNLPDSTQNLMQNKFQGQALHFLMFQPRQVPGKFWPNNVADFRTNTDNLVAQDEETLFVHMAFTESAMADYFGDLVKKGRLFPVFVRSSGDRAKDHTRVKMLSEVLPSNTQDVFWSLVCQEIAAKKKEWLMKPFTLLQ